jgi:hypothetical protein
MTLLVSRRAVIASAAAGAGVLAAAGVPAAAQDIAAPDLRGAHALAVHLAIRPGGHGSARLAALDAKGRLLRETGVLPIRRPASAGAASEWGHAQESVAFAAALARRAAALAWKVPPEQCVDDGRRIAHPPSGRAIARSIWIDFA